jgi:ribosomal protein S18 acetylase RimI-like enzyme
MSSRTPYRSLADVGESIGLAIGHHLDVGFRAVAKGSSVVNEAKFLRLFSGEPHPLGNFAVLSAPVNLASARAAVEPLAAASVPSAVLFPELQASADVTAYLVERGYAAAGGLPAMGVDIARMKSTALPEGYEFVRVGSGPESEEWVRQFAIGYELPVGVAKYFSPAAAGASTAADAPLQFFAIRRNGTIVSTSVCYLHDGLAGIYCVATVPDERRKGLGEHATAEPLRLAAKLGYGVGVLQSSEAGYPVYTKLGFSDFGGVPIFIRVPG